MVRTVVIPARLASERLPRKALVDLGGRPMVVRVAQQAQKSSLAQRVVVATDAQEILNACGEHGVDALLTSDQHPSGTDRVAEAAKARDEDVIINLQGDEPFVDPRDLDQLFESLDQPGVELATLAQPITSTEVLHDPNTVKVVCSDDQNALYFSRAPIPFPRDGGDATHGLAHIGIYGYRGSALRQWVSAPKHPLEIVEKLEQLRALATGMRIRVLQAKGASEGIDTQADLARARARIERLGEKAFP